MACLFTTCPLSHYSLFVDRRTFLKRGLGVAGVLAVPIGWDMYSQFSEVPSRSGVILGGGTFHKPQGTVQHVLARVDLGEKSIRTIPAPFLVHGINPHPLTPHLVVTFEKKGPHAAVFDLNADVLVSEIPPKPGCYFYGHGVFSKSGDEFYATETQLSDGTGLITVRDTKSFKLLGEFPSYGQKPHDCQLIENGEVLALTNGGGDIGSPSPASVTYVEIKTQKLLHKFELTNARFNAGHIARTKANDLVLVSAPRNGLAETELGGLSQLAYGKLVPMQNPEGIHSKLQGEALSVVIDEKNSIVAATHPAADLVSFWNLKSHSFISALSVEKPRGLTLNLDRKAFVLSFGTQAEAMLIRLPDLKPIEQSRMRHTMLAGSHIYNWSLTP